MYRRRPELWFLEPIGQVWVFSIFKIILDFVETFFWYKIFPLKTQVPAVDDGVDECVWRGVKVFNTLDVSDVFEPEWFSDSDWGSIAFVYEVENGVGVVLEERRGEEIYWGFFSSSQWFFCINITKMSAWI